MVAMDKKKSRGGKKSYEAKMKTVLTDLKPKLLLRAGEPWDITEKISREGCKIINDIVQKNEINQDHVKTN